MAGSTDAAHKALRMPAWGRDGSPPVHTAWDNGPGRHGCGVREAMAQDGMRKNEARRTDATALAGPVHPGPSDSPQVRLPVGRRRWFDAAPSRALMPSPRGPAGPIQYLLGVDPPGTAVAQHAAVHPSGGVLRTFAGALAYLGEGSVRCVENAPPIDMTQSRYTGPRSGGPLILITAAVPATTHSGCGRRRRAGALPGRWPAPSVLPGWPSPRHG